MKDLLIYKYLIIGIITVGLDYSMIFLIYTILNMNYILAIVLGFLFSNLFQFYANFFYTFALAKDDDYYRRMILFCISACIGIALGTVTIIFFESYIQSLYISKTLSLFVSFLYGYTASKYIVFNKNFKVKV
jgi:putative flippase GtrA